MSFSTPILFLIFNRPDVTQQVFTQIKKQQPRYLYIAADGPRPNKDNEAEKCDQTRELVLNNINWDCEVKTLFRDENLGCGKAVSEAITWFFDHVEEGIILEDDCLPDESFFTFCEDLLTKYRYNNQVMHISGSYFLNKNFSGNNSYYFTNYIHIWGWATWKRAWNTYVFNLPTVDKEMDYLLKSKFKNKTERQFWAGTFNNIAYHFIDTWDTQWVYNFFKHNGIGISPSKNLISNIGFGPDATHTTHYGNLAELPVYMLSNLQHPSKVKVNARADRVSFKKLYLFGNTRFNRIKFKIGQKLPFIKRLYLTLNTKLSSN